MAKKKRPDGTSADDRQAAGATDAPEPAYVWLVLGIFLLVPVVPWPFVHFPGRLFTTHEIFRPAEVLVFWTLTLFSAVFCLRAVERWVRHLRIQPVDISLVLLLAYAGLSSFWSVCPTATYSAVKTAMVFLIFYVVSKFVVVQRGLLDQIVGCVHLAIAVNNLYAFGQVAGLEWARFGPGEEPIGLIGNRNDLAYLLAMTLPLGLFRAWTSSPFLQRLGRINFYASFLVLLCTRSRSGIVAGLITLLCFHLLKRQQDVGVRRKRPFPKPLKWLVGTLLAFTAVYLFAMGSLFPEKSRTLSSRFFMWELVLEGIREAPVVGHGLGSFASGFQSTQARRFAGLSDDAVRLEAGEWRLSRHFRHAHNEYLQVLYELGALGFLLFVVTVLLALSEFFGSYLAHGNPTRIRWYPIFGSMLVGGLVQALAGFPFQVTPTAMVIVFALAVVSALSLDERSGVVLDRHAESAGGAPGLRVLELLPFAGLVAFLAWSGGRTWLAEAQLHEGMILQKEGHSLMARDVLQKALGHAPTDGRILNELGQAQVAIGDLTGAWSAFTRALAYRTDSAVLVNLGCVAGARGELDRARTLFARAVEMEPYSSENHFRIGHVWATLKDLPRAAAALNRALSIDARNFKVGWNLGRVLADMGHGDLARDRFEQNVALLLLVIAEEDPTGKTVELGKRQYLTQNLLSLAALYERLGKGREASWCYGQIKRYNPQALRPVGPPIPGEGTGRP